MISSTRLRRAWKHSHRLQQIRPFIRTHAQLLYNIIDINNEAARRQMKRGQETRGESFSRPLLHRRCKKANKEQGVHCTVARKNRCKQVKWHAFLSKTNFAETGCLENVTLHNAYSNEGKRYFVRWQTRGHGSWHGWSVGREQYLDSRSGRDVSTEPRKWTGPSRWQNYTRNLPRELHGGGEGMDDFRLGRRLPFPPRT